MLLPELIRFNYVIQQVDFWPPSQIIIDNSPNAFYINVRGGKILSVKDET